MRKLILLALLLCSASVFAQECKVRVVVAGIEEQEGVIMVAVFQNGDMKLRDEHRVAGAMLEPQIGSVHTEFTLPKGKYVFVSFHDENENGELDTNFLGLPKEPYAFSNDLTIPRYKAAEVMIDSSRTVILTY